MRKWEEELRLYAEECVIRSLVERIANASNELSSETLVNPDVKEYWINKISEMNSDLYELKKSKMAA